MTTALFLPKSLAESLQNTPSAERAHVMAEPPTPSAVAALFCICGHLGPLFAAEHCTERGWCAAYIGGDEGEQCPCIGYEPRVLPVVAVRHYPQTDLWCASCGCGARQDVYHEQDARSWATEHQQRHETRLTAQIERRAS